MSKFILTFLAAFLLLTTCQQNALVFTSDTHSFDVIDETIVTMPCDTTQVNSCGVGKPCSTWQDCAQFGKGAECPVVIEGDEDAPNFCVIHCKTDNDCCGNAFCWHRQEFGHVDVGNCVPNICKK